ncbi:MAG: hypothetical protein ACI8TQ_001247 [Planctomycetota bacterium]|jgi:hypothetical protein
MTLKPCTFGSYRSNRFVTACLLVLVTVCAAANAQDDKLVLDGARRTQVIERTLELLRDRYVFPEVGQAMSGLVSGKLTDGAYDSISNPSALAIALTSDLQGLSKDLHLRVSFNPQVSMFEENQTPEVEAEVNARAAYVNYGFERVERLACNVGYIDLRNFHSADLGGPTAIAAMNFVANSNAIIFDLRQNGGGSPEMVQLISSYLFGEKSVHLNSLYWREGESTEEYWTDPKAPGLHCPDVPVFVLTSGRTFSAAEEFSYNLQSLGRATIVGETTGGGAHPGGSVPVDDQFAVWIPMGRAINPITKTNWEGVGVEPEVDVPAHIALEMAHMLAIEGLLGSTGDARVLEELENELISVRERIDKLASGR